MQLKYTKTLLLIFSLFSLCFFNCSLKAQKNSFSVYIRFKVKNPASQNLKVIISGYRHEEPWHFPVIEVKTESDQWSEWVNLSQWDWHSKLSRSGGVAEFPSLSLTVQNLETGELAKTSEFEVQLAENPDEKDVLISFNEKSDSSRIVFLAPYPLHKHFKEFETATQMIDRQLRWAKEAAGEKPIKLDKFKITSVLWDIVNPALEDKSVLLLKTLGINVIHNANISLLKKYEIETYQKNWLYKPDPETVAKEWEATTKSGEIIDMSAFWEIADEVSILNFNGVEKEKLNRWFQEYLKNKKYKPNQPVDFPLTEIAADTLPKNVSLEQKKILYYAVRFGQFWSAKQLNQISSLILEAQPNAVTSTLLPSHGFMGNAWGPMHIGMSYGMLDIFELAKQDSVTQLAVEDWFGLNHMYGPDYTWTGGQTFAYYNAIVRSAIGDKPISMQGLLTPSDDKYLRLKAYSGIGQGNKSFYFWSYGPTYVSTENYWSDLRSQYDGIVKLNRSLEKAEDVIYPAKTIADNDVGILYSVSHDIWNNKNQAPFVEKRLLWHALRHLQVQPNFLREDDLEAGKLDKLKVLYITDWNITRKASAEIDKWVKNGGILYMSAGAATRDEFNEPYTPEFAKKIWIENPTEKITNEVDTYNERTSLPTIKPLTTTNIDLNSKKIILPAIGVRLDLQQNLQSFAKFADGKNSGAIVPYGKGQIIAVGFMPMLAYGKSADFKPKTLEEKWKSEPREIIKKTLDLAKIDPIIKTNIPVVETNLLTGANGSAIVLANYTYQSIDTFVIDVKISKPIKTATSIEGKTVKIVKQEGGKITLELPLEWTDIIILK